MSRMSKVKVDSAGVWERVQQVLGTSNAPDIARMFEITKQSVYEWQRGNLPRLTILIEIAESRGVSLHWLITGKGPREIVGESDSGAAKAVLIRFGEADRQMVQKLAEEEGRTLPEQADRLIAEALVMRGLIPNRYEVLAPILQMLDEVPLSEQRSIAKSLRELSSRTRRRT